MPGGCPYNTSIAIGRLGVPVSFLGRISTNFFGDMQIKRLKESNVNESMIIRCKENPVLAFINVEEGKDPEYAFYEEGTSDRLLLPEELPSQLPEDISTIVFGSISMTMEPLTSTIEALVQREAAKKVIAFDPNIRPFMINDRIAYLHRFKKWVGASTVIKLSLEDCQYILPDLEPEKALEKIMAMSPSERSELTLAARLVIITLGPDGCTALLRRHDGNTIKVNAKGIPVTNLVDTVGAGDTFLGAFLAYLTRQEKLSHNGIAALTEAGLHDALFFANKAAAIVCSRRAAEPPFLEEMYAY
jgi:fructokinase